MEVFDYRLINVSMHQSWQEPIPLAPRDIIITTLYCRKKSAVSEGRHHVYPLLLCREQFALEISQRCEPSSVPDVIRQLKGFGEVFLHFSPCTGGPTWQG
ncbi:MAG: hypothetical protein ACKPKO_57965, partial [Candidatus Fonsibacter sp.]